MSLSLRDGRLQVKLAQKNGRWRFEKLDEHTVLIIGRCCQSMYRNEVSGLGNRLFEVLERMAVPHRRGRGDHMVPVKDEEPYRYTCNFCGETRSVLVEIQLSRGAVKDVKRQRRRDGLSQVFGGLIRIEGRLENAKFDRWASNPSTSFTCSECGQSEIEPEAEKFFDEYKERIEAYLLGDSETVNPASTTFTVECYCRNKMKVRLQLSAVNLPNSRADLFDAFRRWLDVASSQFKVRFNVERVSSRAVAVGEGGAAVARASSEWFNIGKIKRDVDDAASA